MSNVDAAWLGMDSPDNLMMVTAVLHLDEAVDRERLADVLQHRLVARFPKFSMRPLPSGSPFEQPVWTEDPDFDLDRHVVEAGTRVGDEGVAALVSELLGRPLDMRHSPWQFHLVDVPAEGGAALRPGRAAAPLPRRRHRAGQRAAVADRRRPARVRRWRPRPAGPPHRRRTRAGRGCAPASPRARTTSRTSRASTRCCRAPPAGRVVGPFRLARPDDRARPALRRPGPAHPAQGTAGPRKAAAWTERLDLGLIKRVANALDATVNDVLLAVTAGALRRHLLAHGDRAYDLRIFVPVDLRPPGEPVPVTLGNRFGIVFINLPVAEPDPVARVRPVHERMGRVKAGAQAVSTFAIIAIVGALPSWAHRLAVRLLGAKSTAIVTNVPGPREPVFLAGTRLNRLAFWVPQAGSVGLGVSILSYAGEVSVGVAADHNLVPDPGEITRAVEAELADLVRLALPADGEVVLEEVSFDSDLAQSLIEEVQQEYVKRYGGRDETPVDPASFAAPDGTFLVARIGDTAIGCAGMRRHRDGAVEVKRMFVRIEHRRRGHARRLLSALEDWARSRGCDRVVLETGMAQPEAVALYISAGYEPIEGFGHYKDSELSRSFARDL